MTIKGERQGLVRAEFEYVIPLNEAERMLQNLCPNPTIERFRHIVPFAGLRWEVDVFLGKLDGLVLAEVELTHVDQQIQRPSWIGAEVTNIPQYRNVVLSGACCPPSSTADDKVAAGTLVPAVCNVGD